MKIVLRALSMDCHENESCVITLANIRLHLGLACQHHGRDTPVKDLSKVVAAAGACQLSRSPEHLTPGQLPLRPPGSPGICQCLQTNPKQDLCSQAHPSACNAAAPAKCSDNTMNTARPYFQMVLLETGNLALGYPIVGRYQ